MFNNNLASVKFSILILVMICLVNPGFTMSKRAARHFKKANEFFVKNNIIKAEMKYKKAEELSPDDALIPFKMAEMYASIKDWDRAVEYYQKSITLAPADGKAYLNLGNILRTQQKYKDAYKVYQKAELLLNDEKFIYLYLGQIADLMEEDGRAIENYRKFLEFYPENRDARKELAVIYLNNGKNEEALSEYEILLDRAPEAFNDWENYLKALLLTKNYSKIFLILDAVIQKLPNSSEVRIVAGATYAETGEYQRAITEYLKAMQLDDTATNLNFEIGKLYENLKQYDDAIKYYEIHLNRYPESSETYYALSKVYEKKREYAKSIDVLSKLKEVDKEDVKVLREIARNYYMSSDFKQAVGYYQEALKLSPENAQIYFDLAECYILLKDKENAIASFKKSLELSANEKTKSEFASYYLSLGNEAKDASDYKTAIKYFQEAATLDESNTGILLALADVLCENKQNEDAIEIYKKVIALDAENFDAHFNTALIYFETGKYEQAKSFLETSAKINPKNAMIYYMLGVIFDKEKDYAKAIENYQKFVESEPGNENTPKIKKRISIIEQAKKK